MFKSLMISGLSLISFQVGADGFICRGEQESLVVQVYHSTTKATRSAAVMVVSDPSIGYGRQTIARFLRDNGTLSNEGTTYVGLVDPNQPDTARGGEKIAGTKLGMLASISLDVDFSYAQPVVEGAEIEGLLTLTKLNGEVIEENMECFRYLKGE